MFLAFDPFERWRSYKRVLIKKMSVQVGQAWRSSVPGLLRFGDVYFRIVVEGGSGGVGITITEVLCNFMMERQ